MRCHLLAEGKSHGIEWPLCIARFSQPGVIVSWQISQYKNHKLRSSLGRHDSVLLRSCMCNFLDCASFAVLSFAQRIDFSEYFEFSYLLPCPALHPHCKKFDF